MRWSNVTEVTKYLERLADIAEKLLGETTRLRRDVVVLHSRIEPFDGAPTIAEPVIERPPMRNIKYAIDVLYAARRQIENVDKDLWKLRSVVDGIDKDALSREEPKPWLRPRG